MERQPAFYSPFMVFALVLGFLYSARETLTLFLFAILFAYFVEPLVSCLQRVLRGRTEAVAAVYLILTVCLLGLGIALGPKIANEGRSLASSLPSLVDRMGSGEALPQVGQKQGWSQDRQQQIQSFFQSHRADVLAYGKVLGAKLADPVQKIWWLLLIPILALFFLKDGRSIAVYMVHLGGTREEKEVLSGVVKDVNVMLGSYIRAQLILATLTVVAYTLVLSLMRVPYAFLLGPLAGFFEFVPVVGPAIAAVSVLGIAMLTGYPHIGWLILFLGAWRLLQDYVNGPRIMGASLEISPLVQIFAVLAGGEVGGVVGALVSVPAVATLRILWERFSSPVPDQSVTGTPRKLGIRSL